MKWYPAIFWMLWAGVPAALVGYLHRSWIRAAVMAAATLVLPFVVAFTLLFAGAPDPSDLEAWETFSVDVGAPTGYVLAIALTLALFRRRDRVGKANPEQRPEALPARDTGEARI